MLRSFSRLSTGVARSEVPAHRGKITTWAVLDQFDVREVASALEIGNVDLRFKNAEAILSGGVGGAVFVCCE